MGVAFPELPDFSCLPSTEKSEHHSDGTVMPTSSKYMDTFYKINSLHSILRQRFNRDVSTD
jgi:hypothetical protein